MRTTQALLAAACVLTACQQSERQVTFFSLFPPSSRDIRGPANLPPKGYDSEFWIDRQGCSFIKTLDGAWVPRLNLDRSLMCDPTLAAKAARLAETRPEAEPIIPRVSIDPVTGVRTEIMAPVTVAPSYVQIGSYDDTGNGLVVRKRFRDLGFPVVGADAEPPEDRPMAVVLGPFTEEGFLNDALTTAKSLGFEDAYSYQN